MSGRAHLFRQYSVLLTHWIKDNCNIFLAVREDRYTPFHIALTGFCDLPPSHARKRPKEYCTGAAVGG